MAQNWRRVLIVSSLIFSFLLVCGSIYLHLKQKHHLGRLRHDDSSIFVTGGVEAAPDVAIALPFFNKTVEYSESTQNTLFPNFDPHSSEEDEEDETDEEDDYSFDYTTISSNLENMEIPETSKSLLSINDFCLQCICNFNENCRVSRCSDGKLCSFFTITRDNWNAAGQPALEYDNNSDDSDWDFRKCYHNINCAARTVLAYVNKYARDCNKDGVINCLDYIAIYEVGPQKCDQYQYISELPNECLTEKVDID